MPKTPEQWLEETAPPKKPTVFKLFLGYAPGVGKTFNMLSEGIRRHSRGEDVAIGRENCRADEEIGIFGVGLLTDFDRCLHELLS